MPNDPFDARPFIYQLHMLGLKTCRWSWRLLGLAFSIYTLSLGGDLSCAHTTQVMNVRYLPSTPIIPPLQY
jgi:hypothetical protein